MDWPGRLMLVGAGSLAFGAFGWLAAMQQREWRQSANRFDRSAYGSLYGGALIIFCGVPLILAGAIGFLTDSPVVAGFAALVGAAAQIPTARWLGNRYPALDISPHYTHEELWKVRLDALKTRTGCVFWGIVAATAALLALLLAVLLVAAT